MSIYVDKNFHRIGKQAKKFVPHFSSKNLQNHGATKKLALLAADWTQTSEGKRDSKVDWSNLPVFKYWKNTWKTYA